MKATNHAIVRYAQRVMGIDLQEAPEQVDAHQAASVIVPRRLVPVIAQLGDGRYGIVTADATRYRIVVKDNIIVTVLPPWPAH